MKARKKRGPGRPKGKKTGYTQEGLSLFENEYRAKYGKTHDAGDGAGLAHHLWHMRNPREGLTVKLRAEALKKSPDEMLKIIREEGRAETPQWFAEPMLAALDRRDAKFFHDVASALEKILPNGVVDCDNPQEAALAYHVQEVLRRNPSHSFTLSELLDAQYWRGWHTSCPSERTLGRQCKKLGVRMRLGAPKK